MKLLFVADRLEGFKTYKDSTYAMLREAAARGHSLSACEAKDLLWKSGGKVTARPRHIGLTGDPHDWFALRTDAKTDVPMALADFDAVVMR
ncbi:MAG: glutathione synthase, partial [Pseudomonadota bacterium]|nr:glutathione synthase [Pseudomonadota bacterium]